jgi:hypothetical protein
MSKAFARSKIIAEIFSIIIKGIIYILNTTIKCTFFSGLILGLLGQKKKKIDFLTSLLPSKYYISLFLAIFKNLIKLLNINIGQPLLTDKLLPYLYNKITTTILISKSIFFNA